MSSPLISVVVPTLNQARFIEQTLASIVGQNWPRLELIVIDGGSTDGTREIVERYPVTHFVSEPDRGQCDAINKGMRLARGDILAWLNSDDYYLPLALARAAAALGEVSTPKLVHGGCLMIYQSEDRGVIGHAQRVTREQLTTRDPIYQPSTFWTRHLWEKAGELREDYHFALDWEWWLRAAQHAEFQPINEVLSVYLLHPGHKAGSGSPRRRAEILEIVGNNATPEWSAAYRAVASRIDRFAATWRQGAGKRGLWSLHQLLHLDLYARYGHKVDVAFSQLSSLPPNR